MKTFQGEYLRWAHRDGALEVALHRSPCNEIGSSALTDLERLASYVNDGADGARALVLYSELPSGFCAGADLRELYAKLVGAQHAAPLQDGASQLELRAFIDRIHRVFDTLDMAPITTVAAVHGPVFGGGFELALCSDVIVADASARFCFPELRLGLIPGFGGIPRLRRDVGNALIRDLLLTGRSINADRAYALGLISQRVGQGQALDVARSVAKQAAKFDRTVTQRAKAFIKLLPAAELESEKTLFCDLMFEPVVQAALEKFVNSKDLRAYLP